MIIAECFLILIYFKFNLSVDRNNYSNYVIIRMKIKMNINKSDLKTIYIFITINSNQPSKLNSDKQPTNTQIGVLDSNECNDYNSTLTNKAFSTNSHH